MGILNNDFEGLSALSDAELDSQFDAIRSGGPEVFTSGGGGER